MQIKSKYKIARRLGPEIFDKTQTQKFANRLAQRKVSGKSRGRGAKSDFGRQLLEKQKVRFTYGINERQFAKYVNEALAKKSVPADKALYERLETRLDNVIYRMGLAPSRLASRQIVSHGHIMIKGVRITIPSQNVKVGDKLTIRPGSEKSPLFANLDEKLKNTTAPVWLRFNPGKKEGEIVGKPIFNKTEQTFDIAAVFEFYRR